MNKWLENINKTKSALVLGGGGSRGCYEIGAWRAFAAAGLHFDIVCGTSIGAIVGAMYTQQTLAPLIRFAENLQPVKIAADMFSFPDTFLQLLQQRRQIGTFVAKYILSAKGMDISPLQSAFNEMFDYEKFMDSPVEYACVTFNVSRLHGEVYTKKDMTPDNAEKIILASASCYPAFPMMKMNDMYYIDGGYADNLPVDAALDMGAKQVLAIDVEGPGIIKKIAPDAPVLLVKPMLPLPNFLDFNNEAAVTGMLLGALETAKLCSLLSGFVYTFEKKDQEQIDTMSGIIGFIAMTEHFTQELSQTQELFASLAGFHPSDLSAWCAYKTGAAAFVEMLAWIFEIEAARVYSYPQWLSSLVQSLQSKKESALSADLGTPLSLRRQTVYLAYKALQRGDRLVWTFGRRADFIDVICARIWLLLESMYPIQGVEDAQFTNGEKSAAAAG
jgi:NTE family protein